MPEEISHGKESVGRILSVKAREIETIFDRYDVTLAYLFGSQARESVTPLSDVDVAVLFAKEVPSAEYSDRQISLITEFMRLLSRNDIDVLVLNVAPPLIRHNALKGRLLHSRSDKERVQFEVRTRREYLDSRRIRDIQNKALVNRYLGHSKER